MSTPVRGPRTERERLQPHETRWTIRSFGSHSLVIQPLRFTLANGAQLRDAAFSAFQPGTAAMYLTPAAAWAAIGAAQKSAAARLSEAFKVGITL
jgi:hypothetical protein